MIVCRHDCLVLKLLQTTTSIDNEVLASVFESVVVPNTLNAVYKLRFLMLTVLLFCRYKTPFKYAR